MNKKTILTLTVLGLFALLSVSSMVSAKAENLAPATDEAVSDGIYDVHGRPDLKVRVFVHHAPKDAKPIKPGGNNPVLVCDLANNDSTSVVPSAGWKLPTNVTYRLNTSSAPLSVGASLSTIASNAFSDWSSASGGKVNFTKGASTSVTRATFDSQNIIAWGRTSGSALAVTYTWYTKATGQVAETDTIFNSTYPWAWSGQDNCAYTNVYDAENILTHETGHWMGLDDTYTAEFVNNTMYGYGSTGESKKNTLTTGDKTGISNIYQ